MWWKQVSFNSRSDGKGKKLKIERCLHLHTTAGSFPVKMFFSEFSCAGAVDRFSVSCDELQFLIASFPFEKVEFNEESSPVLIYVPGFAARKMKAKLRVNVVCCY